MTVDYGDDPLLGLPELVAVSQRSCSAYNKKRPEKCPSVSLCVCDFTRIKST